MKIFHVTEVLGKYFDWSLIPDQLLAEACTRGNVVHITCGAYALGAHLTKIQNPAYRGFIESFIRWFDDNVAEVVAVEQAFINLVLGYTGRLDFLFRLNSGELALVDIKTPAALSKTWRCQLAAYNALLTNAKVTADAIMSLRLKANGGPALGNRFEGNILQDYNVFLSALNAHRALIG